DLQTGRAETFKPGKSGEGEGDFDGESVGAGPRRGPAPGGPTPQRNPPPECQSPKTIDVFALVQALLCVLARMEGTAMRKTLATFLVLALASCGEDRGPGIPKEVTSIIFLQRSIRNEGGNVFDYLGYQAGSRIVKLEPPAADGKLTVLTSDPMWTGADFMAWDLSFDASTIVFSARLANEDRYQIFTMHVDGTNPKQLTDGPRDHVYPIFIPGQKILFYTNDVVEPTAQQFRDEYERATTAQVGIMNQDGT